MFRYFTLIFLIALSFGIFQLSTTKVHMIRHGEKVIQKGIEDAPLTERGKMQAKTAGNQLKKREDKPEFLYASPMRRARQTAFLIQEELKVPLLFDSRLTEKSYYQTKEKYEDGHFKFSKHKNGIKESASDHLKRLMNFIEEKATFFNQDIWIIAHGGLMARIFEKISKRTKRPLPRHLKLKYASEFVFEYNKLTGNFKYLEHYHVPDNEERKI